MPDYAEEDVERAAEAIYDSMLYDGPAGTSKPSWTPRGNSHAQVAARGTARTVLDIGYTAGALAMKEAAADALDAKVIFGEGRYAGRYAQMIRALPVPPRGSKI